MAMCYRTFVMKASFWGDQGDAQTWGDWRIFCGASLLAKAVDLFASMLDGLPPSRASSAPTGVLGWIQGLCPPPNSMWDRVVAMKPAVIGAAPAPSSLPAPSPASVPLRHPGACRVPGRRRGSPGRPPVSGGGREGSGGWSRRSCTSHHPARLPPRRGSPGGFHLRCTNSRKHERAGMPRLRAQARNA